MSNLITHQLHIYSPSGELLTVVSDGGFVNLAWALKENEPGVLELILPGEFDKSLLTIDTQIEVYRAYGGLPMRLEGDTAFFVRRILFATDNNGTETISITAYSALDLMRRRIIAYFGGSSYTDKITIRWDDLLHEIVRENYGDLATDADRDLRPWLTVEGDLHFGASYTKTMPWREVLAVLQEICDDVRSQGEYASFDVIRTSAGHYEYRVFLGPRGNDHSSDSALPVIVSEDQRNLLNPSLEMDWTEEHNYIYATGMGTEDDRVVETAWDEGRYNISPFNRQEFNRDARQAELVLSVQAEANQELEAQRPKQRFLGTISQTPGCIYGVHWGWGDIVTAQYRGAAFDCHVDAIAVSIDSTGTEQATGQLLSENNIYIWVPNDAV